MFMKKVISLVLLLLLTSFTHSQKNVKKTPPIVKDVKDSIVEITYTDGTKRRMVWINDSTVMLIISNKKNGPTSKAYIDPEFAESETEKYFKIKREEPTDYK